MIKEKFKNLSPNISNTNETTIIAETGIVEEKNMILFNGQIISQKKIIQKMK